MNDNMTPKLSVIVPVYNVEKYIHQCIESIINQQFRDFELIIVDDGSPDSCPQICDDYASQYGFIRVIHQPNGGVSRARNSGIEVAQGKWLYFVDSDDWITSSGLSDLVAVGEQTNADVVFTDCVEQYDSGKSKRLKLFSNSFSSDDPDFISQIQCSILCHKFNPYFSAGADNAYPAPWSKLIRTQLVKDNGIRYDPYVQGIYDDGLFTINILEHARHVSYQGTVSYNYRIVNSSLVHTFRADKVTRFEKNCERMNEFIKNNNKNEHFKQAEYCRRIAYLSSMMTSFFFNPENKMDSKTRVESLRTTIARSIWADAIRNAQYDNLESKHKYTLFCMRNRLFYGLALYAYGKQLKQKASS